MIYEAEMPFPDFPMGTPGDPLFRVSHFGFWRLAETAQEVVAVLEIY